MKRLIILVLVFISLLWGCEETTSKNQNVSDGVQISTNVFYRLTKIEDKRFLIFYSVVYGGFDIEVVELK